MNDMLIPGLIAFFLGFYLFLLGMKAPLYPPKLRGSKLVACGGLALCFIASFLVTPREPAKPKPDASASAAAAVAAELKKEISLPKHEGDNFSIIDITANDDTLIYIFRIGMEKEDARPLADKMQAKVMLSGCEQKEFREMLKHGIGIEYRYQDKYGGPLGSAILRPAMCNL